MKTQVRGLTPNSRFDVESVFGGFAFTNCSVVRTAADGVEAGWVVCVGTNIKGSFEVFSLQETDEVIVR